MPKVKIILTQWQRYGLAVMVASLLFLFSYGISQVERSGEKLLRVYFFDVGQGDSVFLLTPHGRSILVDGGPDQTVVERLGQLTPYWNRRIDYLFLSHGHADHVTGLLSVLKQYQVGKVFWNNVAYDSWQLEAWVRSLDQFEGEVLPFERGSELSLDGVTISALWPPQDILFEDNPNNTSIVLHIAYRNFDVLLTGDVEGDIQPLIEWPKGVEALKVPHQGARGDLWSGLIEVTQPFIAVISVGENTYGHPDQSVIRQLRQYSVATYRTDKDGTIGVVSDGTRWWLQ